MYECPDDYRLDPDYDPYPQYDEDDDIDFKIDQHNGVRAWII